MLSTEVRADGLDGFTIVDQGDREFIRLEGGAAPGLMFDVRRPSEDTLRYWIDETGDAGDLDGFDRDALVQTIRDLAEDA